MFVYHIFMTSPLWLAVGPQSIIISRIIYKLLNLCPFDYMAFAVIGNVGYTFLTTPVG